MSRRPDSAAIEAFLQQYTRSARELFSGAGSPWELSEASILELKAEARRILSDWPESAANEELWWPAETGQPLVPSESEARSVEVEAPRRVTQCSRRKFSLENTRNIGSWRTSTPVRRR